MGLFNGMHYGSFIISLLLVFLALSLMIKSVFYFFGIATGNLAHGVFLVAMQSGGEARRSPL